MLVAELEGVRVEAAEAQRGPAYVCPQCKGVLILRQGRKVIWHFAHKPPTDCAWATGETVAHLEAKKLVRDSLVARGLRAEIEYIIPALPRDRRADVMAWSSTGVQLAFELQHTSIGLDEIEERARSYARAGIAQIWIPFLSKSAMLDAKQRGAGCRFIERYSARPFERWVHGFHGTDGMWMYAPADKTFWHGSLAGHRIWVDESSWFEQGGWSEQKAAITDGPSGIRN